MFSPAALTFPADRSIRNRPRSHNAPVGRMPLPVVRRRGIRGKDKCSARRIQGTMQPIPAPTHATGNRAVLAVDALHRLHRPAPVHHRLCLHLAFSPLLHPGTGGHRRTACPHLGRVHHGLVKPGHGIFFSALGMARRPARAEDHGRAGHVRRRRHHLRHGAHR